MPVDLPAVTVDQSFDMGHGGLFIGNLYAFRATKPMDLRAAGYPVGPDNDQALRWMARVSSTQIRIPVEVKASSEVISLAVTIDVSKTSG